MIRLSFGRLQPEKRSLSLEVGSTGRGTGCAWVSWIFPQSPFPEHITIPGPRLQGQCLCRGFQFWWIVSCYSLHGRLDFVWPIFLLSLNSSILYHHDWIILFIPFFLSLLLSCFYLVLLTFLKPCLHNFLSILSFSPSPLIPILKCEMHLISIVSIFHFYLVFRRVWACATSSVACRLDCGDDLAVRWKSSPFFKSYRSNQSIMIM